MTMGDRINTWQQLLDEQADAARTRARPETNIRTTVSTSTNQRQR